MFALFVMVVSDVIKMSAKKYRLLKLPHTIKKHENKEQTDGDIRKNGFGSGVASDAG